VIILYPDSFAPRVSVLFAFVIDDFGNEIEIEAGPIGYTPDPGFASQYERACAFGRSGEVH